MTTNGLVWNIEIRNEFIWNELYRWRRRRRRRWRQQRCACAVWARIYRNMCTQYGCGYEMRERDWKRRDARWLISSHGIMLLYFPFARYGMPNASKTSKHIEVKCWNEASLWVCVRRDIHSLNVRTRLCTAHQFSIDCVCVDAVWRQCSKLPT